MNPRFKVYPPTTGTWTKMKVYRSNTNKGILATVPIYDGAFQATFTDTDPGEGRVIWYLVSLAQDSGEFVPGIAFSVGYCKDWGPATMAVATGMGYQGTGPMFGNAQGGVMDTDSRFILPTQGSVLNWAQMVTAATSLPGTVVPTPPATVFTWNIMYANGRIIVLPRDTEGPFRITNQAVTQQQAALLTKQMATWLDDPIRTENIYTVGGFKYKLRIMDTAMANAVGECFVPNAQATAVKGFATTIVRNLAFVNGDTGGLRFEGSSFYGLVTPTTDSMATFYPFTYFEYNGPA